MYDVLGDQVDGHIERVGRGLAFGAALVVGGR